MKRQALRKGILFFAFLLFPITLYYFSPYLILLGVSEGLISGSFIVFALMFLTSLFFGRAFCGWLCPAGGMQECMRLFADRPAKGGKWNWTKFLIWVPWVTLIAVLAIRSGGLHRVDFFYMTESGISVAEPTAYIIYYFILLLIFLLGIFTGRRGMCHYACWMAPFMIIGTRIRDGLRLPGLRLKADAEKCVACGQCTKRCPMSLPVQEMTAGGLMRNDECILCGECVDVCPKKVIRFSGK